MRTYARNVLAVPRYLVTKPHVFTVLSISEHDSPLILMQAAYFAQSCVSCHYEFASLMLVPDIMTTYLGLNGKISPSEENGYCTHLEVDNSVSGHFVQPAVFSIAGKVLVTSFRKLPFLTHVPLQFLHVRLLLRQVLPVSYAALHLFQLCAATSGSNNPI